MYTALYTNPVNGLQEILLPPRRKSCYLPDSGHCLTSMVCCILHHCHQRFQGRMVMVIVYYVAKSHQSIQEEWLKPIWYGCTGRTASRTQHCTDGVGVKGAPVGQLTLILKYSGLPNGFVP
jgi:hypothetical protein